MLIHLNFMFWTRGCNFFTSNILSSVSLPIELVLSREMIETQIKGENMKKNESYVQGMFVLCHYAH